MTGRLTDTPAWRTAWRRLLDHLTACQACGWEKTRCTPGQALYEAYRAARRH